jgi:SAM-dependent methyltransferase
VTPRRTDFYEIPALYDILHAPGTAREVDGLERIARRFLRAAPAHRAGHPAPLRWLEPACGTGRYLRVLARRGHRAIGFDASRAMVDYARRRLRDAGLSARARVILAPMTDFAGRLRPRSVHVAFNLINTIRHLESDDALLAHLRHVARVLRPGGFYAVGLGLCRYDLDAEDEDVWIGRRGGCRVHQVVQYLPPRPGSRFERVISHLTVTRRGVRGTPASSEHVDSVYRLRTYDQRQWTRVLTRSPFRVEAIVDEFGRDIPTGGVGYGVFILRPR